MQLGSLLCGVEIEETNIIDFSADIPFFTDRSSRVKAGCAFVCVSGICHDGHDYIAQALAGGAALIIAQRMTYAVSRSGTPYIITPDTRKALALMWSAWYSHPQKSLKLYAVTGTNGKSTTCALLRSVLESAGYPCGIIGSVSNEFAGKALPGNPMTTPDPELLYSLLAQMKNMGARAVVTEASSHALALGRLWGLHFEVGVFTNLSPEHLDFHVTMDEYARAKSKLFTMCERACGNADDPYFDKVTARARCPVRSFSVEGDADICAREVMLSSDGIEYMMLTRSELFRIKSPLVGRFSVYNTLAAASAAYISGIPSGYISDGIARLECVPGRMQRIENSLGMYIYVDYAHTPRALETVLTELSAEKKGRLITVFGCGGERDRAKRPLMGRVSAGLSDLTVITSDNPRGEPPDAIISEIVTGAQGGTFTVIRDRAEAIRFALDTARENDTVLIAGKGHENYQIMSDGLHPFSDIQTVKSIISKKTEPRNEC